ncbi:hypothetical protein [Caballeronia sordidicola]|uniref:hypothetical protein n=1 Tax=Caballeronia sordidicola TaxID=196367 RepID=UPI000B780DA5|nr:hypothetical protein [Caballeronia sordidicola]
MLASLDDVETAAAERVYVDDLSNSFGQFGGAIDEFPQWPSRFARRPDGPGMGALLRLKSLGAWPSGGTMFVGGTQIPLSVGRIGRALVRDLRRVNRVCTCLGIVFKGFELFARRLLLERVVLAETCGIYSAFQPSGEQPRIAIARRRRSKVMLLDEAISDIDAERKLRKVDRAFSREGQRSFVIAGVTEFALGVSSGQCFYIKVGRGRADAGQVAPRATKFSSPTPCGGAKAVCRNFASRLQTLRLTVNLFQVSKPSSETRKELEKDTSRSGISDEPDTFARARLYGSKH